VAFASPKAEVLVADQRGIKIAGQLVSGAADDVTFTETQVFADFGGARGALGVALPAYLNAGGEGQVQGIWDYSLTVLTDGKTSVAGSSVYQAQSGGLLGTMLAQYTSPQGDVSDLGIRVLLSSQGDISSVQVVDVGGSGAAGVNLEVGGRLTPYLLVPDQSGGATSVLSTESIAVSQALGVDFARLPVGTPFDMGVIVGDVADNYVGAFVKERVR